MNKMKKIAAIVAFSAASIGSATAETSANVAVTTDYVDRGISYSDGAPAIQGGVDYEHESGFAAGVWGSSIDDTAGDAGIEIDLYASFSVTLNEFGYSLGYINYRAPGGDTGTSSNVSEIYLGATYQNYGVTYYMGDNDLDADYLELTANFDMNRDARLSFGAGYTFNDVGDDITDFKVAISTQIEGLDMELAYTDTDISNPTNAQDSRVFFTVSKSM